VQSHARSFHFTVIMVLVRLNFSLAAPAAQAAASDAKKQQ
jgi:hypothetical protein